MLSRRALGALTAVTPLALFGCSSGESYESIRRRLRTDFAALPGVTESEVTLFDASATPKLECVVTAADADHAACTALLQQVLAVIVRDTATVPDNGVVGASVEGGGGVKAVLPDVGVAYNVTLKQLRTR